MFSKKNLILLIGRHMLIIFGVTAISASIVFFLSGQIHKMSESIAKNRQLAAELQSRISFLSQLKEDAQILGTNDALIDKAFLSSDNITEFISILEGVATKNGVIQTFRFDSPTPSSVVSPFPLSSISYHDSLSVNLTTLIAYLKVLEALPYFMKITTFSLAAQEGAGIRGISTVSFNGELYTKATQ